MRTPDYNVVTEIVQRPKQTRVEVEALKLKKVESQLYCSLCDSLIDINDSHAKNHLKISCPGVKSTPLSTDHSRSDLFQRLAAIGARKKLFSSDHTFSPSPTQTPGSMDRQGMG